MNQSRRKLSQLRESMKERGLEALIIPNSDPHLGESSPEHWKIVRWLTGFTGSSATLIVTKSFAGFWTDSRYFLQAEMQLKGSGFTLMRINSPGNPSVTEWMGSNLRRGSLAGFDGRIVSESDFRQYMEAVRKNEISFDIQADLVSDLWENRPPEPGSMAFDYHVDYAGETRESKIMRVREKMAQAEADFYLVPSPDEIMWLLNIRASDVSYSPLMLSYALISPDQVLLFADEQRIPKKLAALFDRAGITILPYNEVIPVLTTLPSGSVILASPADTPVALYRAISEKAEFIESKSIIKGLKAVKNDTELANLRKAMERDGVALTKFFFWLEEAVATGHVTENGAAQKIKELRLEQANCTGESFPAIVAFNSNAALPHYTPGTEAETYISRQGILLVDSGGQYLDGTTDVTRCVALDRPSVQEKHDFTLALKGTIALATARFPKGTRGFQLDSLARRPLWDHGINFGHGTGHGVGFFLNVHESPPSISPAATPESGIPLEPGMIISDEPAIYMEGKHGFRTENILAVKECDSAGFISFLEFETLTQCYIDCSLVDVSLLDAGERKWLNDYNAAVFTRLKRFLLPEEQAWLSQKTRVV